MVILQRSSFIHFHPAVKVTSNRPQRKQYLDSPPERTSASEIASTSCCWWMSQREMPEYTRRRLRCPQPPGNDGRCCTLLQHNHLSASGHLLILLTCTATPPSKTNHFYPSDSTTAPTKIYHTTTAAATTKRSMKDYLFVPEVVVFRYSNGQSQHVYVFICGAERTILQNIANFILSSNRDLGKASKTKLKTEPRDLCSHSRHTSGDRRRENMDRR